MASSRYTTLALIFKSQTGLMSAPDWAKLTVAQRSYVGAGAVCVNCSKTREEVLPDTSQTSAR